MFHLGPVQDSKSSARLLTVDSFLPFLPKLHEITKRPIYGDSWVAHVNYGRF